MKYFSLLIFVSLINFTGIAQCSEIFISEYIEGSSSNKAFEIYNPTDEIIDLTDYVIYRNNNGSLSPSDSLFPQGFLEAGDVFVVANPGASLSLILSEYDTLHTMTFYNGDDALWIKKISTGDTIDVIGTIGVDPGSGWTVGAGATNNFTLIRQISVQHGQTDWAIGATEWDVYPIDTDDSLGAHSMINCYCYKVLEDTACNSYLSPSGDETWTSDGIYTDTLFTPGPFICDTIFTVNLVINTTTFAELDSTVCDSLVSPSGLYTWTGSGIYNDTIPNVNGCDSVLTFDLTVHNASGSLVIETVCDSFVSPSGETLFDSGIYFDTLTNVFGCDSVISINLTVNYSSSSEFDAIGCKNYVSPSGKIWDSGGTYLDTIPNASGCDSLITINLTIYNVDVTVTQTGAELSANNTSAFYQWLDCDNDYEEISGAVNQVFTATDNGNYAVQISQDGCTDTSSCYAVTGLSILENDFSAGLKIYPNPTKGELSIRLGTIESEVNVKIYSTTGELLLTENFANTDFLVLDIDGPSAYYFVEISTGDNQFARVRILKE